ncbi:hypothetical protein ACWGBH_03475 [Streptomyces massasporeus]
MFHNVDTTAFPPLDTLPADVADLIKARDAAYDGLDDFEIKWHDVLSDNWHKIAEAKDSTAAADAARAGKDAFKGQTEVAKARDARPRVLGVHRVMVEDLRKAERAAQRAFRAVADTLEAPALEALQATAQAAEDAYRAFLDANAAFGLASRRVAFARAWANGDRPDWPEGGSSLVTANGEPPAATEPVAMIREVLRSFGAPHEIDPLVLVVGDSGTVLELKRSQALALVGSNSNSARIIDVPDDAA